MSIIFTWLKENALNIGSEVLSLFIAFAIMFVILSIFVRVKRWYNKAKISRQKDDFKEVSIYIEEHSRPVNTIQRLLLSQTGSIYSCSSFIYFVVMIIIGLAINLFILRNLKVQLIILIVCITLAFPIWISSIISLIRKARFLSFMIWTTIIVIDVHNSIILIGLI